jgi:CheY-like chemotaxis protein
MALLLACVAITQAQTRTRTPTRRPPAARPAPKAATPKAATPRAATPRPAPKAAEPKPADTAPKPAETPATPPAAEPAKKGPATAPEAVGPPPETDPAVLSALDLPRSKPADYLQAVFLLIDLGRPQRAKPIFDDFLKLSITDDDRLAFVEQFGAASMLKLARAQELAPEGAVFAQACMALAAAARDNPQHIQTLINQLADPSLEARLAARHDLAAIGPKAATATLEALARETNRNRRAALAEGVADMHPLVDGMLLAMLDTRDNALRAQVATLTRQLEVPQALPLLASTNTSLEQQIRDALFSYEHGTPVFPGDHQGQVEFWQWDDADKRLSSVRLMASEARTLWLSKLARMLYRLRPDSPEYQRQALVQAWEATALDSPTRRAAPDPQKTAILSTQMLNEILADALKQNYPHAAAAAADALAMRGDRNALFAGNGQSSPLTDALASPSAMVRFAALRAIMALDPSSPYAGSSRVPDALTWFAGGGGVRQAVVAMPTQAAASDLAGQLRAHSIAAEATNRGRDALLMARDMTDVEAIFVDMDILLPGIREVIYELRTNPSTGTIPIAILAADGQLEAARKLAAEHHGVIAISRPHSAEVVASTLKSLADVAPPDTLTADERAAQAAQARSWIAKLESAGRPFYVFRRTALLDLNSSSGSMPEKSPSQ